MIEEWVARRSPRTRARLGAAFLLLIMGAAFALVLTAAIRVGREVGLVGLAAVPLGLIVGRTVGMSRRRVKSAGGGLFFVAVVAAGVSRSMPATAQLVCFGFVAGVLAALLWPLASLGL